MAAKEQAAATDQAAARAATDQAAKDQAAARAKEQAAKEQAAKEQAAKEQAAKEQAAKEQAAARAKEQAAARAKEQAAARAKEQAAARAKEQAPPEEVLQDQILSAVRTGQEATLHLAKTWVETFVSVTPNLFDPRMVSSLRNYESFAETLWSKNLDFVVGLFKIAADFASARG